MKEVSRRQRYRRQLRADLLWVAGFFVVLQIALAVTIDRCLPQVRDGHWAALEKRLHRLRAASPGAKLVVMVGSSRTQLALQGGRLSKISDAGGVVVFNLGINGSGPMMELVALHRLLDQGIRPDAVLVELNPIFLSQTAGKPLEETMLVYRRLSSVEALAIQPYFSRSRRLLLPWVREQLLPCKSRSPELHLLCALDCYKPWVRPTDPYVVMDDYGWCPIHTSVTEAERRTLIRLAKEQYGPRLQHFKIAPSSVRVLQELFDLCECKGITTAGISLPEGRSFRALYPPEVDAHFQSWLRAFCRERQIALVNARDWVPEIEFYDGHHLLPEGARTFTERLGREFMEQFLEILPEPDDRRQRDVELKMAQGM